MTIKILVAYHKKAPILKNDILVPIHLGRALCSSASNNYLWLQENLIGDDTGTNISFKNKSYNELTALYWAWKNYDKLGNPDYIGLMHYRRHFVFNENSENVVTHINEIDDSYLNKIGCTKDNIERLLVKYGYLFYNGCVPNIKEHYLQNHHGEDLDIIKTILDKRYPGYVKAFDRFLESSRGCFGNMFVFPRQMFFDYCEWIFSILEEFEKIVDISDRRLFISERLTGAFVLYNQINNNLGLGLPTTFLNEERSANVAIYVKKDRLLNSQVTISSIINKAQHQGTINFYILSKSEVNFDEFSKNANVMCTFKYVTISDLCVDDKIMYYVCDLLPASLNKVLFVNDSTLFFLDIFDVFDSFNNYDFPIVYGSKNGCESIYCFDLNKIRKIIGDDIVCDCTLSFEEFVNAKAEGSVKQCSSWIVCFGDYNSNLFGLYEIERFKVDDETRIWSYGMYVFPSNINPSMNLHYIFSVYWWMEAFKMPSSLTINIDANEVSKFYLEQSLEILDKRHYD